MTRPLTTPTPFTNRELLALAASAKDMRNPEDAEDGFDLSLADLDRAAGRMLTTDEAFRARHWGAL